MLCTFCFINEGDNLFCLKIIGFHVLGDFTFEVVVFGFQLSEICL